MNMARIIVYKEQPAHRELQFHCILLLQYT